jgi:hypothetical protein
LGDVLEAIIGAVWIDSGCDLNIIHKLYMHLFGPYLELFVTPETYVRNPLSYAYEFVAKEHCQGLRFKSVNEMTSYMNEHPSVPAIGCEDVLDSAMALCYSAVVHSKVVGIGIAETTQAAKIRAAYGALLYLQGRTKAFWDEAGCDCATRLAEKEKSTASKKVSPLVREEGELDIDLSADEGSGRDNDDGVLHEMQANRELDGRQELLSPGEPSDPMEVCVEVSTKPKSKRSDDEDSDTEEKVESAAAIPVNEYQLERFGYSNDMLSKMLT